MKKGRDVVGPMRDVITSQSRVGRGCLQQLCLVNIDDCKNTQVTFVLFYFTFSFCQLRVCCRGPDAQEISIDCCSGVVRRANAGNATLSAYVRSLVH